MVQEPRLLKVKDISGGSHDFDRRVTRDNGSKLQMIMRATRLTFGEFQLLMTKNLARQPHGGTAAYS